MIVTRNPSHPMAHLRIVAPGGLHLRHRFFSEYGTIHDDCSAADGPDLNCPGSRLDLGAVDRKLIGAPLDFNHYSKLDHTSNYTASKPLWLPWSWTDVGTILQFLTYTYSLS